MDIKELLGKTFVSVKRDGNNSISFMREDGSSVVFEHTQDCCESVVIEDVVGDLADLEGTPIVVATETTNGESDSEWGDHVTWTFYNFATVKGHVNVRWCGSSNGYYSESVYVNEYDSSGKCKGW